jgi:hypothetical protein
MTRPAKLGLLRRGCLTAAALAVFGCAYQLVRSGAVDSGKVSQIEAGIQKIRELKFEKPVPLVVESRNEAERDMEAQLAHEVSDEEFRLEGQAGALIGLYPPGIELKQATLKLLKDQVAGFYDPDTKRMILVSGAIDSGMWDNAAEFLLQRDVMGEMVLAHELTHALQDQHFQLSDRLDALKNNDDAALALKSVAEGDATISGFAYVVGGMDQVKLDEIVSRLSDLPALFAKEAKSAPVGLREPLIFQYSAGVKFVAEAYRRGGWTGIDDLFRQQPQSSQQILHPELYFEHPTPPVEIMLAGYQAVLGGWTKADQNCEGELVLNIILKQAFGDGARQVLLALGWKGDAIVTLTRGSELSVLWMIAMSSERSAAQFAAAYTEALDRRLQLTPHRVDYETNLVLVVIGEAARSFAQLEHPVFAQSRLKTLPPPRPAPPAHTLQAELPAASSAASSKPLALTISSRSLR